MRPLFVRVLRSDAFAATLLAIAVFKLAVTGVITGFGQPAWMGEELPPLFHLLIDGKPITEIGIRQYGVVAFLIFDPIVRLFGASPTPLNVWSLVVGLISIGGALALAIRRYFRSRHRQLLLAAFWLGFTPTAFVVEQRHVETFELLFLTGGLFFYTARSGAQRSLAGIPLALGMLTKLLPGAILAFLTVRDWRGAWKGWIAAALLLLVGQFLYGSLMGLQYPIAMLSNSGDATFAWSTQHENNSLRALIFKVAAGFHLANASEVVLPASAPALNVIAYLLAGALFAYLVFVGLGGRRLDSVPRRSFEFALAIVTMLLISPGTAHDPMILTLPAFTVLGYLWVNRLPTPWPLWLTGLALGGAVLIGVFLPIRLVGSVIPLTALMTITGNTSASYFGPNLAAYDLLGFPGFGLLLTWVALVSIERRWSHPSDMTRNSKFDQAQGEIDDSYARR